MTVKRPAVGLLFIESMIVGIIIIPTCVGIIFLFRNGVDDGTIDK